MSVAWVEEASPAEEGSANLLAALDWNWGSVTWSWGERQMLVACFSQGYTVAPDWLLKAEETPCSSANLPRVEMPSR